ncbi:MAG: methylmalonyl Co-A mutase-associated GTPase MeaB [Ignavibacteriae bacterium]|nr:methylmalonyl Co-A mutase-associated GTPase MeaB [Ignavibacteriota bacterium]NOG98730.1 methylmalonyl Co-A mutase-associated GTPase MeaB [Ignavibacteriota bacterium]
MSRDITFLDNLNVDNKKLISRLISKVEENNSEHDEILSAIHKNTGNAYRIGITGPPGAGKSSITNQLVKLIVSKNKSVGIIAVDPTSPFSGGALLGDRVRMSEVGGMPGVYIRSMATRGSLGGLSHKTIDAADVLDAAGFDFVIFETVGVGQSELDIAQAADTTFVVLVPESGDAIQAMKAGLMEIADFFVMNKCDRPGFESAISALRTILMFKDHDENSWLPEIIKAVATENKGITEIFENIEKHRNYLDKHDLLIKNRKARSLNRIKDIVKDRINFELSDFYNQEKFLNAINEVVTGSLSPYQLAEQILKVYKDKK